MKPILVLQMQRMGDLILTFPLIGWLTRRYPEHPVWTVAEPRFFSALHPIAPKTVFFPPEASAKMRSTAFHSVINISHRYDAAHIAGNLTADTYYGPRTTPHSTYAHGYFSLYRASIVHNNRHNLLHWSDMHLLDHIGGERVPHQTGGNRGGNRLKAGRDRVGLFVGASEPEKRPTPHFFAQLAQKLLRKGLKPLFLGGPDDAPLGATAAKEAGIGAANLCGQLTIAELAEVLSGLALCVTPDTGPMHLAAWINAPVLNLSLGPVNPWETGPAAPGHHVLRASCSCAGCWKCQHSTPVCHSAFTPQRVALVIHTLLHAPERLARLALPGLALYRTARDTRGLSVLEPVCVHATARIRPVLGMFWREWFLANAPHFDRVHFDRAHTAKATAALATFSKICKRLREDTLALGKNLARHCVAGRRLPEDFWTRHKPLLRPFTGFLQLRLQNENNSPAAWEHTLADIEGIATLLRDAERG